MLRSLRIPDKYRPFVLGKTGKSHMQRQKVLTIKKWWLLFILLQAINQTTNQQSFADHSVQQACVPRGELYTHTKTFQIFTNPVGDPSWPRRYGPLDPRPSKPLVYVGDHAFLSQMSIYGTSEEARRDWVITSLPLFNLAAGSIIRSQITYQLSAHAVLCMYLKKSYYNCKTTNFREILFSSSENSYE